MVHLCIGCEVGVVLKQVMPLFFNIQLCQIVRIGPVNNVKEFLCMESDFVWVFTGLRSGGKAYYAFDVSSPDAPSLKWRLNSLTTGFGELGLTWSVPEVALVPGISDPVLIFAGGYDVNKSLLGFIYRTLSVESL
mgnify:CR=1 FL=1